MSKIVSVYTVTNLGCSRNLTIHINLINILLGYQQILTQEVNYWLVNYWFNHFIVLLNSLQDLH
jgi:hypothetical protein